MKQNRAIQEEAIFALTSENKRLKRENQRLRESLDELERYKAEYCKLIEELNEVKEVYVERIEGFNQIEKEYRKALNQIMDKKEIISGK